MSVPAKPTSAHRTEQYDLTALPGGGRGANDKPSNWTYGHEIEASDPDGAATPTSKGAPVTAICEDASPERDPTPDHQQAIEKRLVRKLDLIFLPLACISIIMKKIDQSNYKAAYTAGMRDDLSLAGTNVLNWLDIYFTIPLAIFQVPSILMITRVRPSLWLPALELCWGVLTGCMAAASSVQPMYVLRWLIGMCEASAWPGTTVLLLSWYTPREMAKRQAVYLSASYVGSMFTFAMQSAIHQTLDQKAGLPGWRWLFVINGIMTVVVAVAGFFLIPDYPEDTRVRYLTSEELIVARRRLESCGKRTQSRQPQPIIPLLLKTLKVMVSWKFCLLFLAYAPWAWSQQANAYFNLFLDSLRNGDGSPRYSTTEVTNIPVGGYAISVVSAIAFASLSDRLQVRWQLAIFVDLIQLLCTSILAAWPANVGLKMFAFFLSYTTGINESILIAWVGDICKDNPTERAVIIAWTVSVMFAGNASMPLGLWPASQAPDYKYGYKVAVGFCVVSVIGIIGFRFFRS
ncbi:major facilitator superfamily transporter [Hortaea werneckii]|nr:major facilitator superfamily transporter [Hortaea werneckii]